MINKIENSYFVAVLLLFDAIFYTKQLLIICKQKTNFEETNKES